MELTTSLHIPSQRSNEWPFLSADVGSWARVAEARVHFPICIFPLSASAGPVVQKLRA